MRSGEHRGCEPRHSGLPGCTHHARTHSSVASPARAMTHAIISKVNKSLQACLRTSQDSTLSAKPSKPYDARLASALVRPLVSTRVTPNHLTTLRLLAGLGAVAAFAAGSYLWINVGAMLFVLSNFLDHADGELARISGKSSRFGHAYDLACDVVIHVFVFIAIGYGLRHGPLGVWAVPMGALAGITVSLIFSLRIDIENRLGKAATWQPRLGGFEIEDVLYLMPLVTLNNGLQLLLIAAAIGAPTYALWVIRDYLRLSPRGDGHSS